MVSEVKIAAARQEQSAADKDDLLQRLRMKPRKRKSITLLVGEEPMQFDFEALSSKELDKLKAKHPPTREQRAEGFGINHLTFNPALVAATLATPKLSEDDALELFSSDMWNTGELQQLVDAASEVCLQGMDIPFTGSV